MTSNSSSVKSAVEATQEIYKRVAKVISPEAWAEFAPDIVAINNLKAEKNAVILAHNYMTPEVFYGVADIVGDSLALAREAATVDADIIISAGVHFMAETAKLMNPDKTVLVPDLNAGCSLAESITPEDVRKLKTQYPGVPVVTYVNTSAAVKAECDICCTSGNAKQIVESLGVPEVIMVPDRYLAENVANETDVRIISWHGSCEVHEQFKPEDIKQARIKHDGLSVVAHPECPSDVVKESDFAGSTVKMTDWVNDNHPKKVMLVTESSMSDNVSAQYPDIEFIKPCLSCPHMKLITLKKIRMALEEGLYEIEIPEEIALEARRSVQRMVDVK